MTSNGHCSLTATNSSAVANIASTYVSAKANDQITVSHAANSGMTDDVMCTPNQDTTSQQRPLTRVWQKLELPATLSFRCY